VREAAHPEANIIFGTVIDDALGDELRITVIAAGFDGGAPPIRRHIGALGTVPAALPTPSTAVLEPIDAPMEDDVVPVQVREPEAHTAAIDVRPRWIDEDALDVPEFLK
jgi:cell division protein FtsZ